MDILDIIFLVCLSFFTYGLVPFVLAWFKAKIKVFAIVILCIWITLIFITTHNDLGFWYVIGNSAFAVCAFFLAYALSIVCPNCGSWNEYEEIQVLESEEYSQWETEERAIRDNKGNQIGSYDTEVLHTYRRSKKQFKCTNCGEIFEKDFVEEI